MSDHKPADITSRLDLAATEAAVKEILKDGTPKWVSHPEDFRSMAQEVLAEEKEHSDEMARPFALEDRDILTDEKARLVNFMHALKFIRILEKEFRIYSEVRVGVKPGTAGLWVLDPKQPRKGFQYVCFIQVPVMPEWDLMHVDSHGLSQGHAARGWRTVLACLIEKYIITERKVHEVFGEAAIREHTSIYRETLYELRHRENIAA
jgi:hypothetical protein